MYAFRARCNAEDPNGSPTKEEINSIRPRPSKTTAHNQAGGPHSPVTTCSLIAVLTYKLFLMPVFGLPDGH